MTSFATFTPPAGWKRLTAAEQKAFIDENFGEDNVDVEAVFMPEHGDGTVYAQVVFQPVGYVEDKTPINANIVRENIINELNILNKENDSGADDIVRWKNFAIRPRYDAKTHCVEYGIELLFGKEPAVNLYKMCLLRDGALVLTVVGTPRDKLSLAHWQMTPKAELGYDKFDPNRDNQAEGNLNHLLSMNRFL